MENAVRREAQEKEQSSAGSSIAGPMLPGPRSVEIETNLIVRAHES